MEVLDCTLCQLRMTCHSSYESVYILYINGIWIGDRVYWTRYYTSQITIVHRLVFSVTLFGSGFQRQIFLCFLPHVLEWWRPSRINLIL
jgi:hypothetical protein